MAKEKMTNMGTASIEDFKHKKNRTQNVLWNTDDGTYFAPCMDYDDKEDFIQFIKSFTGYPMTEPEEIHMRQLTAEEVAPDGEYPDLDEGWWFVCESTHAAAEEYYRVEEKVDPE